MKRLLAIAALALLGGCGTSQRIAALENDPHPDIQLSLCMETLPDGA